MGESPDTIVYIGDGVNKCTWEEFRVLANLDYDNGYGEQEIASKLFIVFSDLSAIDRVEYEGSEWWSRKKPVSIGKPTKISTLNSKSAYASVSK